MQAAPSVSAPPWWQLVADARAERGLSQDDLAYEARKYGAPSTLTGSWIAAMKSGKRPLHADVLEAIAAVLKMEPTEFAEYRLARARELLDEGAVGLDQALANLEKFAVTPADLAASGRQRSARASKRGRERSQTERRATRSSRGGA